MAVRSWLFVKGSASVRLVRTPLGLRVLGPGAHRTTHNASDEQELTSVQSRIEAQLRGNGWTLEGYDVERRGRSDRRKRTDRRATKR